MTRVTLFYRNFKKNISGFIIEGHTGYSESGSDIVCSAVTVAAMTAVNGLTDVVGVKASVKVCDGYIKCILPAKLKETEAYGAKVLFDSMFLTLKNIERQYSDYIVIKRRCLK